MNDVRKVIYGTLIVFVVGVLAWVGYVFYRSCGLTNSCPGGAAKVERTPIPTLFPAAMPTTDRFVSASADGTEIMRPSNPGVPGPALDLTGNIDAGKFIFDVKCVICHGTEGTGGVQNPGSKDGTVPALNPVNAALKDANYKTFATNLDLFIEHGSTPEGNSPVFQMAAWGDNNLLAPQQIADVLAYIISLNP